MSVGLIDAPQQWLGSPVLAMPTVIVMNIWFGFPFMMVAILAGLQTIPRELYEAADMDGASTLQAFWYITLPSLWQVIMTLVVLRTIWIFNNFDFIYLTTGGGPIDATTTLPIYAYNVGWQQYDLGRMAAVALIMMIILGVILMVYAHLLRTQARTAGGTQ